MKAVRRIIPLTILLLMLLTTTALAASYAWSFTLDPGQSTYSYQRAKADNEQKAYVRIDSGNWISGDKVWFRVRRYSDDASMTETKWANGNVSFTLNYSVRTGVPGVLYRLKMQQDSASPPGVSASGYWTP